MKAPHRRQEFTPATADEIEGMLKPKVMTDDQFALVAKYADEWNDIIFPLFRFCVLAHIRIPGSTEMGTQGRFFDMARKLAKFTLDEATKIMGRNEDMKHYDEL